MAIATMMTGELNMAYETKVLLILMAEYALKANDVEEVYEAIKKMANAEGVILKSYTQAKADLKKKEKKTKPGT